MSDLVADGYITAIEDVPYRQMETRYILALAGLGDRIPDRSTLYEQTLLAKAYRASGLTHADAYSVTHTIFYLSDFGLVTPAWSSKRHAAQVETLVSLLAARYVAQRNWDLAAEMLLCLTTIQTSESASLRSTWEALGDAWDANGSVPGPSRSGALGVPQHDGTKPEEVFRDNYHTTLVAVLAVQALQRQMNDGGHASRRALPRATVLRSPSVTHGRDISSSLRRCEAFLETVQRGTASLSEATAQSALVILVIRFLIAVLEPSNVRHRAIRRRCDDMHCVDGIDLRMVEPTVVLLASEIAERCERSVPGLEAYHAGLLKAVRAAPGTTSFRAVAKAVAARTLPDGQKHVPDFTMTSPVELRRTAAAYLVALTADPVDAYELAERDKWLVSGQVISALHRGNLELASLLCRVLTRCEWQPSGFEREVLAGFVAAQHPHGFFGFDHRVLELAGETKGSVAEDARATVTLVSLWAMAESAIPGFLLLEPHTWPACGK